MKRYQSCYIFLYITTSSIRSRNMSGIDIALWDIMGKATNQPVYNLLGGRTRSKIQAYASRLYASEDLDAVASEAQAFLDQGFVHMKQRFGYGPREG